ncbi:uncharacterized protein LOC117102752 [Anneissia japonica]|uniref:uncharacterized protein LOC117102752 n=1 Tax=Anneissia japonica TaxID=1529436 RepID=UPI001425812F|nr:uncharacterized protein LOC117102752 [Anneissia japonica]
MDNWCSLSKKEMELCTMWVIIYMSFLHLALSFNVILYPDSIITSVGNNPVTFNCTIQLETNETTVEHWIIWWKDNTRIVDNDNVLTSSTKYSVHGVSSAAMTEYTQILHVNSIEEADHGMYTCTLVFESYPPGNTRQSLSSHAPIIIRYIISQPRCSAISSNYETGQQQVILLCACSPSDPPITLHWINNMGAFLTSKSQVQFNELLAFIRTVSNVSESSKQLFTCRATSAESTDTRECEISNLISTTSIAVTQKPSEPFDEKSTVIPTKTTYKDKSLPPFISKILSDTQNVTEQMRTDPTANVTQEMLIFSGDKKTTTIAIIAVAGVIFITVFIILVLLKKRLNKRKYEESESPEEGTDIHNGNQLTSIEVGDGQLDDQCSAYKSSVFERDKDEAVNCYASSDPRNMEKCQKPVAMDNNKKANRANGGNGIYPLEYNGYKKESVSPNMAEDPTKFKTDDMKDAVTLLRNEDTNSDALLMTENYMYVSADEVTTQRNTEKADMLNTACSPNEDDMKGNVVNTNDDPYPMEENMMYVSADEVKLSQRQPVMHYQAESGDIYAEVVKSKT